jgi:CheY-like chemotaxis protein
MPDVNKLLSGRRLLVVEDEMMLLMIIQDMLADLGCESVAAAPTVAKAIALIETQVFDAAMVDINLNGEKSYPVADALALRGVPFIFSTGYSERAIQEGYRHRPLLKKPFPPAALADMLECILPRELQASAVEDPTSGNPDNPIPEIVRG